MVQLAVELPSPTGAVSDHHCQLCVWERVRASAGVFSAAVLCRELLQLCGQQPARTRASDHPHSPALPRTPPSTQDAKKRKLEALSGRLKEQGREKRSRERRQLLSSPEGVELRTSALIAHCRAVTATKKWCFHCSVSCVKDARPGMTPQERQNATRTRGTLTTCYCTACNVHLCDACWGDFHVGQPTPRDRENQHEADAPDDVAAPQEDVTACSELASTRRSPSSPAVATPPGVTAIHTQVQE